MGVVYGDIGTSPLYALREALHGAARDGILGDREVIGIVSLAALDADPDRYAQVRRADAPGRQPGRRWDALPACARPTRGRAADPAAPRPRDCRGRAVLWRRRDHSGDLGALGRRGAQARDAGLGALRAADHRRDPLCSFLGAEPRHRAGLSMVRPDNAGVVRDPGRSWIAPRLRPAADLPCDRPVYGGRLPRRAWARVVRGDGLGVPRGDRSRGALRRYGPFRPGTDPLRLVGSGVSGARAQLPRPGQPRPRPSRSSRKLLLPARPGLGPARARSARNRGHRNREPSGDHRRLFSYPAGRPARPSAPFRNPAHVGRDARPDLYAEGQRAPACGGTRPDGPLRQLLRARWRLRHRGDRHHDGHLAARLSGASPGVALALDRGRRDPRCRC